MNDQIPMTILGVEKLRKELEMLKTIKRPKIIKSIIEARQHGDLKENSEYHAAREEQGFCEGRIKEIELKLSKARIIDITKVKNNGVIIFGSTVTILNLTSNQEFTYRIVGDDESNFKRKLISINSPMSRGLVGKKVSDVATIKTPVGDVKYKILKIEYN
ncbi:transcription elongation factor GreA [Buchnera aphidicola str. Bp (Baizongia pistaciae)]|uniref:Transcription elongation factor GreA n=1 Tax=Buchnera aphidicola subsp. Baizongia pistaciae (strain Bp) TaxID=224915 RepID=GREA_BUCBP|nr:transcription elongation factor GreA [Buchnera aphidicola]P59489.1 RecName: Full=Transcription elongation factor GreA; AltName: Full=Transcript cleavage factor GreA [Buchnera aphidicola str. Bp (Baizongia pistaciae)]AAO27066.1 transcription elongation factor GreA [Buchnera aphidicola str. Bp (Baizongia pistaciae)]